MGVGYGLKMGMGISQIYMYSACDIVGSDDGLNQNFWMH